jgi:hypothetical protein
MITVKELRERIYSGSTRKRDWSKWLPWLGSATALLALGISCAGFYATYVRQYDDIRVVVDYLPTVFLQDNSNELTIDSLRQRLTFINSGNRPGAIIRIALTVGPSRPAGCDEPLKVPIYYEFDSFVIKAGEIVSVSVKNIEKTGLSGRVKVDQNDVGTIPRENAPVDPGATVLLCLSLTVVTPDNVTWTSAAPLFDTKLGTSGEAMFKFRKRELHDATKPIPLIHNRRLVFF